MYGLDATDDSGRVHALREKAYVGMWQRISGKEPSWEDVCLNREIVVRAFGSVFGGGVCVCVCES